MSIRAIVLTRNEADYIVPCLDSLRPLTNDIIVIDSRSTDGTAALARDRGAKVIERDWAGFAATRNWALESAADVDWVLFLDADERLPPALAAEIAEQTAARSDVDGYWIPRRNVICGRIMRGSGWWPDYQLRVMRPNRCRYSDVDQVHEWPYCYGVSLALNTPLVHLNYRSWHEFAAKQFDYARLAARGGQPSPTRSLLTAPARLFWHRFVANQGFRDGFAGLTANTILSASEAYRVWLARGNGS